MEQLKKLAVILLLIVFTILSCNVQSIAADLTKTKGSLTIIKYETGKTPGSNTPLAGVKFKIYKVADDATDDVAVPTTATAEETTGTNGKAVFPNLDLGRYLVVEAEVPANVTAKIENFVVDIPQTTTNGTDLEYDVTVEPKNNTAYGTVTLTKQGVNNAKLSGVSFLLQKKNTSTNAYEDYPDTAHATLSTNANGQIIVENLLVGDYRFIETNLGSNDGYILDNKTAYEFTVSINTTTKTAEVSPSTITVNNPKPDLTKIISSVKRNSADTNTVQASGTAVSATANAITSGQNEYTLDVGDTVSYKLEADIPSTVKDLATYKVDDAMDAGLTLDASKIAVKIGATTFEKDTDYTLTSSAQAFTVTFTDDGKTKLNGNSKVEIDYDATLNSNADATATGNSNRANLTYSNVVKTNYKNETNPATTKTTDNKVTTVYTGGLQIEKRENSATGATLPGAVFKLASTEANAKAGTYVKDSNGSEITLTTGSNGTISYKGLSYGTYYLVEVQAPSYTEGGETKYYSLLNKPKQITVSSTTYTSSANLVINRKPKTLINTGGISALITIIAGVILIVVAKKVNGKKEQN